MYVMIKKILISIIIFMLIFSCFQCNVFAAITSIPDSFSGFYSQYGSGLSEDAALAEALDYAISSTMSDDNPNYVNYTADEIAAIKSGKAQDQTFENALSDVAWQTGYGYGTDSGISNFDSTFPVTAETAYTNNVYTQFNRGSVSADNRALAYAYILVAARIAYNDTYGSGNDGSGGSIGDGEDGAAGGAINPGGGQGNTPTHDDANCKNYNKWGFHECLLKRENGVGTVLESYDYNYEEFLKLESFEIKDIDDDVKKEIREIADRMENYYNNSLSKTQKGQNVNVSGVTTTRTDALIDVTSWDIQNAGYDPDLRDQSTGIDGLEERNKTVDEIISDAQGFVKPQDISGIVDQDDFETGISKIYNILFAIGMVICVIWGVVLGIRFLYESADGQAKIKEQLIPYIIGVFVVFGAFGIWKIVLEIVKVAG